MNLCINLKYKSNFNCDKILNLNKLINIIIKLKINKIYKNHP